MQPNEVQMVTDPGQTGFQICEEHHRLMIEMLKEFGVEKAVAQTKEEVDALLEMGKSDPILDISRVLFTIALNAIGSKDLLELKCPVCAFQQFDFLAKITGLVAIRYRNQEIADSALFTPPPPKLILPS